MDRPELSPEALAEIERRYDPETAFRAVGPALSVLVTALLAAMSVCHFYAALFALIPELTRRGVRLSFVLGLAFLLFGWRRSAETTPAPARCRRPRGAPPLDLLWSVIAVAAAMHLPLMPPEALARRVGAPSRLDVLMGSALLILTLAATRRAVGPTPPLIAVVFLLFALYGPSAPGARTRGGARWEAVVDHLYITTQGVYGVAIGVMANYVLLLILFGALATRVGLGQLFIDLAMALAGRHAGGPAKVALFASPFMGAISGFSIANTVTTGALSIPAMEKIGYPAHVARAVEATASTGGQITPPVLGAAAFIMVEYLQQPLRDILAASLFPALLRYFGVFVMAHLEAKRLGLRGLAADETPRALRRRWMTLIPLALLVWMILAGRTPDAAAVYGVVACIVVGFLNAANRLTLPALAEALAIGARNTLALGAAAATVGVVVGVATLTGVGFPARLCRGADGGRSRGAVRRALAADCARARRPRAVLLADPDRHRLHRDGGRHPDHGDLHHPRRASGAHARVTPARRALPDGRSGVIRTHGPCLPKTVLYQAELHSGP